MTLCDLHFTMWRERVPATHVWFDPVLRHWFPICDACCSRYVQRFIADKDQSFHVFRAIQPL